MSALDELERYTQSRHRHMGRGELMEPDAGLASRIVAALLERGVEESELDELVHEAAAAGGCAVANETAMEGEQDAAIANAEHMASTINNQGFAGQVEFLMQTWGAEALLNEVRGILRSSAPTPA